jgi:hypothetical protein
MSAFISFRRRVQRSSNFSFEEKKIIAKTVVEQFLIDKNLFHTDDFFKQINEYEVIFMIVC